jgi:hypothetical protein
LNCISLARQMTLIIFINEKLMVNKLSNSSLPENNNFPAIYTNSF